MHIHAHSFVRNVNGKLLLAAAAAVALIVSATTPAQAKRAMPPKSKICNKTAKKVYVATINYAGVGSQRTKGWRFIAPGQCADFQDDAFHFRGNRGKHKRVVTGLSKRTRVGCVTNAKAFQIWLPGRRTLDKAACTAKKGHQVTFQYVNWGKPGTINVIK